LFAFPLKSWAEATPADRISTARNFVHIFISKL
jgi:hypothetical protein